MGLLQQLEESKAALQSARKKTRQSGCVRTHLGAPVSSNGVYLSEEVALSQLLVIWICEEECWGEREQQEQRPRVDSCCAVRA